MLQSIQDAPEYTFLIIEYVVVPEPQDTETLLLEIRVATAIMRTFGMLPTVSLYNQPLIQTCEVNDIMVDRQLSLELVSCKALGAENLPKAVFGIGLLRPHASGALANNLFQSLPPLPNPSPALRGERDFNGVATLRHSGTSACGAAPLLHRP